MAEAGQAAPPSPGGGLAPMGRPSLPEGARCAVHTELEAAFVCERCGSFGCAGCRFGGTPPAGVERVKVCRACASGGLDEPIPWERRAEIGWLKAGYQTTALASFQPTRFFRTPSLERGLVGPLIYAAVLPTLAQILSLLIIGTGAGVAGAIAGVALEEPAIAAIGGVYFCMLVGMSPFFAATYPIQALMNLVIAAGCEHGTLALMKRSKAKFEDTLRAVSYAYAPTFWMWVPGCGWFFAYPWMLYSELVAIRETHRCGNDGAALAVFGFRLALLVVFGALYVAMFVAMFLFFPDPELRERLAR